MIKPTIGRVVWFFNETTNVQPNAAMVCWVHDDNKVNLVVFDEDGNPRSEICVYLAQGDGQTVPVRHCEWMPYQIGQAKKESKTENI
jgi:hypothetical protein